MHNPAENERQPMRDVDTEPQRTFLDTRYPRSIEGIVRLISVVRLNSTSVQLTKNARNTDDLRFFPQPMALIGIILAAFGHSAGVFFLFVGISFIIYVSMVFIVEVCVPGVFVHRLVVSVCIEL